MTFLVVLIVNDPDDCPAILDEWEAAGVLGVTILQSTGLGHIRRAGLRDDISLMPSLSDIFESDEVQHRTLLSVVEGQEMVDKMVAIAQRIIGNLDDPHTGFLFCVPVAQVYGLGRDRLDRSKE
jgi:hypothetical protein